jgi:hypothetical protein
VVKHLIIKRELETVIWSLIGVCLSIDIIEVIPRSLIVHVFIRMNLLRPRTNQASSVQYAPIFFISSLSSLFFHFLIDLLRLIIIFVITVNQYIGGCLILIDGCDFKYDIFHLYNILTIYDDLLCLLLKLFIIHDVLLIEFFS